MDAEGQEIDVLLATSLREVSGPRTNRGIWYAVGAYLLWGMFPIYWKLLHQVPALELICHRVLWSCLTLYVLIALRGRWRAVAKAARQPRTIVIYLIASVLIGFNWLVFIWGVNSGYIIETSLGYFINPLLNVLLGVVFFRERLRPWQLVSIVLASAAVLYLTLAYGSLPWIALALAVSFGLYGVVKKIAPLDAVTGLTIETSLLIPIALCWLACRAQSGEAAFLHLAPVALALLLCSGAVTTLPLLLFAAAAQRVPLSQIGVLQYIAPTLQFLLGALVYHEKFTPAQFVGFVLVWISLALFGAEGALFYRKQRLAI
jgi:chloramphenicol-sensitive protein RarD